MIVLLVLGLGLIGFGAVVLLRFPASVGGSISIAGMNVSSTGAGLPLIVLGVVAVMLSTSAVTDRLPELPFTQRTDVAGAAARGGAGSGLNCFPEVPADRIAQLEVGANAQQVLGPQQSKEPAFAVTLTENGQPLAQVRLLFVAAGEFFKVDGVAGADCKAAGTLRNQSRGGDPRVLLNFDTLELRLPGGLFALRPGHDAGIVEASFGREAP